jgi:hypothetical protein
MQTEKTSLLLSDRWIRLNFLCRINVTDHFVLVHQTVHFYAWYLFTYLTIIDILTLNSLFQKKHLLKLTKWHYNYLY